MIPDRALADEVLQDQSEQAFRVLYRRHTPRLYQMVLRLLGGSDMDAEDAVQETWVRAADHLARFEWRSSFNTWLVSIGLNVAREFLRRQKRVDFVDTGPEWEPVARGVAHGERMDLERAIACLPAGYRTVLVLHDVEGFTHPEIGELLGVTSGTSKSQLFAARRAMRILLEPELEQAHEA